MFTLCSKLHTKNHLLTVLFFVKYKRDISSNGVSTISSKKDESPWRALALVSAIGIDLAITVLLGVWLGSWLDERMNTDPLFLIIGIFLGLAVGIIVIIRLIKPFTEDNKNG